MTKVSLNAIGERKSGKTTVLAICKEALDANGFICLSGQHASDVEILKITKIDPIIPVWAEIKKDQTWQHRINGSVRVIIISEGKMMENTWVDAVFYSLKNGQDTNIYSINKKTFLESFLRIY